MMSEIETATFAGGCFWCMVRPFDTLPGIKRVLSGYTGGTVTNPIRHMSRLKAKLRVIRKLLKFGLIRPLSVISNWLSCIGNKRTLRTRRGSFKIAEVTIGQ